MEAFLFVSRSGTDLKRLEARCHSKTASRSDMTLPASASCVRLPAGGSSSLSVCLLST